jgi:hypothetical protein
MSSQTGFDFSNNLRNNTLGKRNLALPKVSLTLYLFCWTTQLGQAAGSDEAAFPARASSAEA